LVSIKRKGTNRITEESEAIFQGLNIINNLNQLQLLQFLLLAFRKWRYFLSYFNFALQFRGFLVYSCRRYNVQGEYLKEDHIYIYVPWFGKDADNFVGLNYYKFSQIAVYLVQSCSSSSPQNDTYDMGIRSDLAKIIYSSFFNRTPISYIVV
jgi:hypothetical protein